MCTHVVFAYTGGSKSWYNKSIPQRRLPAFEGKVLELCLRYNRLGCNAQTWLDLDLVGLAWTWDET